MIFLLTCVCSRMSFQIEGVVKPFAAEGAQVALQNFFKKYLYCYLLNNFYCTHILVTYGKYPEIKFSNSLFRRGFWA
jgi:hypothetical protein